MTTVCENLGRETIERVLRRCRALGFALAGVCAARPSRWGTELWQWLEQGRHGEMQYLANHAALRIDPAKFLPGARSVICVADRYWGETSKGMDREAPDGRLGSRGRIARYARGEDYHDVMRKRLRVLRDELAALFPSDQFRVCVDTAPVLEREHAGRAGLGAIGKHTLLIEPGIGSYLLLGEVVTTLELAHEQLSDTVSERGERVSDTLIDPCGSCTRCIDACPTQAITPWSVDAGRCISYLTIEHRSEINERFHEAMGDWIFGCDICQEVCPHNQPTRRSAAAAVHEAYQPRPEQERGLALKDILSWTEEDRGRIFAKSALKRATLAMMKRNAIIAAGNVLRRSGDEAMQRRLIEIAHAEDEDAMVRATARTVLGALDDKRPSVNTRAAR